MFLKIEPWLHFINTCSRSSINSRAVRLQNVHHNCGVCFLKHFMQWLLFEDYTAKGTLMLLEKKRKDSVYFFIQPPSFFPSPPLPFFSVKVQLVTHFSWFGSHWLDGKRIANADLDLILQLWNFLELYVTSRFLLEMSMHKWLLHFCLSMHNNMQNKSLR